jgi:hypothetical protein
MSHDDSNERRVVTRKELVRELRHQAYEKAKQRRANDPRTIAMKQAAKIRRREIYQQVKARKKTAASAQKSELKKQHQRRAEHKRAATDAELMQLITFSAKGSNALN